MTEKLIQLDSIPDEVRIKSRLFPSLLFPANATIRAGDLQLEIVSVNDRKDTVTFKIVGVWLQPKGEGENVDAIDLPEEPKIIMPNNGRIIKP